MINTNYIYNLYDSSICFIEKFFIEILRIIKIVIHFISGLNKELSTVISFTSIVKFIGYVVLLTKFLSIIPFIEVPLHLVTFSDEIIKNVTAGVIFTKTIYNELLVYLEHYNSESIANESLRNAINDLKTQVQIDNKQQQLLIQQLTLENSKLKANIDFEQERSRLLQSLQNDLLKQVSSGSTSTKLDNVTKVLSIGTTLISLCLNLHNVCYGKPGGDIESSLKELKELILILNRENMRQTAFERSHMGAAGLTPRGISLQDIDNHPRF